MILPLVTRRVARAARRPFSSTVPSSLRAFPPPTSERQPELPPVEPDALSPFGSFNSMGGLEMGSSLEELKTWGGTRSNEIDEVRKGELWADPYVRMLQEPKVSCTMTGKALPKALTISLRPALYQATPEDDRQQFVFVPEEVLHSEYASFVRQPREHGTPNLQGPRIACSDALLAEFDSTFAHSTRLFSIDLPISEPLRPTIPLRVSPKSSDNRPAPDLEKRRVPSQPAGAMSTRIRLNEQVRSQLVRRISQEVELLAEKLAGAEEEGKQMMRVVGEEEREAMRDEDWDPSEYEVTEGKKVVAILELDTPSTDIGAFFYSSTPPPPPFTTKVPAPAPNPKSDAALPPHPQDFRLPSLIERLKNGSSSRPSSSSKPSSKSKNRQQRAADFHTPPAQTTCPLLSDLSRSDSGGASVPYYPLTHLFSSHPLLLPHLAARLAYLSSPIPTTPLQAAGPKTYALLSSPSYLLPQPRPALDTYPLFRALFRLRLFDNDGGGWDASSRAGLRPVSKRGGVAAPPVEEGKERVDEEERRRLMMREFEAEEEREGDGMGVGVGAGKEGETPWPDTRGFEGGERGGGLRDGRGGKEKEQGGGQRDGLRKGGGQSREAPPHVNGRRDESRTDGPRDRPSGGSRGGKGGGGFGLS